jgi:hypothetical protein
VAVRKTKKGADLKRWFKEEWVDVRTGKPCGRKEGKNAELRIVALKNVCQARLLRPPVK